MIMIDVFIITIKIYKQKIPITAGIFMYTANKRQKKSFINGFNVLVCFFADIICVMNIGGGNGGYIIT